MELFRECDGGAGGAAVRVLRVLFGCVWALFFSGCAGEKTYCDGLNESNMPGAIVLVERMDDATRYELPPDDQRVSLPDDLSTLISCGDIDGLGRLNFPDSIALEEVTYFSAMDSSVTRPTEECVAIYFWGADSESTTGFGVQYWDSSERSASISYDDRYFPNAPMLSEIDVSSESKPSETFDLAEAESSFYVSQLSQQPERFNRTPRTRPNELVFCQETEDGVPPLVIGRAYSFRRGDVPEGLAEYLGVPELQDEGFQCVDLFFGYYEEGD